MCVMCVFIFNFCCACHYIFEQLKFNSQSPPLPSKNIFTVGLDIRHTLGVYGRGIFFLKPAIGQCDILHEKPVRVYQTLMKFPVK